MARWKRHREAVVVAVVAFVLGGFGTAVAGSFSSGASLSSAPTKGAGVATPRGTSSARAIGTVTARSVNGTVPPFGIAGNRVACNSGEVYTGGGVLDTGSAQAGDAIVNSAPDLAPATGGWIGEVINNGPDPEPFTVYVLCAT